LDLADITFIPDDKESFALGVKNDPGWFIEIHLIYSADPLAGKGDIGRNRPFYEHSAVSKDGQKEDKKNVLQMVNQL
jgi:hypothetical protein